MSRNKSQHDPAGSVGPIARLFEGADPGLLNLINISTDWIWQTDSNHVFVDLSDSMEPLTGLRKEDWLGRSRMEILQANACNEEAIQRHMDDLRIHRQFRNFVYELKNTLPGTRWMSVNGDPLFGENGEFLGFRGTAHNITKEVEARLTAAGTQEALTKANEKLSERVMERTTALARAHEDTTAAKRRLEDAVNAMQDGFVIYDADERLIQFNKAFADLYGRAADGFRIGRTFEHILRHIAESGVVPEAVGREEEWIRNRLETYRSGGREQVFQIQDGRWIHSRDRRVPSGETVGVRYDITDLKKREQALVEAKERMAGMEALVKTALNTIDSGIVVFDKDDNFVLCNKAQLQIYPKIAAQYKPGATIRSIMQAALDAGQWDLTEEETEAWVRRRMSALHRRSHQTTQQLADGRWILSRDYRSDTGLYVGVHTDITGLKHKEHALEEAAVELTDARKRAEAADRAKSEFLANMSHEIRTPMNGVLGMAELMLKTELDSKQRTFANVIVNSGNALLTIINDVLDFSKMESGRLSLESDPFDLRNAVEDVAALVSAMSEKKGLEVVVHIQPGTPDRLIGDAGRIRQILTNLVGNAVKFTDEGHVLVEASGVVEETGEGAQAELLFKVEDSGPGIPPEVADRIFEKFLQVDGTLTRKREGTGLGLAISSMLVELMGGKIGVESQVGRGSTFWFTLPLQVARETGEHETQVDIGGTRILVVDDNEVNRMILLEQLSNWGFDAGTAASGREALAGIRHARTLGRPVDLIILDFQMPGMDGAAVASEIRADAEIGDTPIIMLTSVGQGSDAPELRDLRLNGHLVKPARSSLLRETLVKVLQRDRIARGENKPDEETPPASPIALRARSAR